MELSIRQRRQVCRTTNYIPSLTPGSDATKLRKSITAKRQPKHKMATRLQVTCINKADRYSAHERIENIGGYRWKHTEDDAIAYIENDVYSYYISRGGYEARVIIATRLGRKYLKTEDDGESPDNLLSLPECP
jgi:Protein of unknown function (DUF3892)